MTLPEAIEKYDKVTLVDGGHFDFTESGFCSTYNISRDQLKSDKWQEYKLSFFEEIDQLLNEIYDNANVFQARLINIVRTKLKAELPDNMK